MSLKYALALQGGLRLPRRDGWKSQFSISASSRCFRSVGQHGFRILALVASSLTSEESTWVRCEGLLGQERSGRKEARGKGRGSDGWKRSGVSVLCLCAAPAKNNKASATLGSDFSVEEWQETSSSGGGGAGAPHLISSLRKERPKNDPPHLPFNGGRCTVRADLKSVTPIFCVSRRAGRFRVRSASGCTTGAPQGYKSAHVQKISAAAQ